MITLTDAQVHTLVASPDISERQRTIARMRYVDHMEIAAIAETMAVTTHCIGMHLRNARKLALRMVSVAHVDKPIDAAWFQRQVAYVRSIEHDPEHQGHYLNGIEIVHGIEMRKRVEEACNP